MNFREITPADFDIVSPIFQNCGMENWEHCFPTVLVWSYRYDIKIAIEESTVFLRFTEENCNHYIYPAGKLDEKKSIEMILADAKEQGKKAFIYGMNEDKMNFLKENFPGIFEIKEDRDDEDYIYLSEDLINLTGKKYQKKRNHISRFKRDYPNYKYISMSGENLYRAKEFEKRWSLEYAEEDNPDLAAEAKGIARLLDNFEKMNLMGAMIEVDGKIAAMSIAAKISDDMVDVIVEKARHSTDSAYAMINREFAADKFADYKYINREDDMGLEGLRKAKMSYFPYEIQKKYTACEI